MEKNNKFTRQQISGIGEAYHQIAEAKTSIGTSSSSSGSDDMGFGGKGNAGLGLDGKSNWYGKPTTTTGKPTGKGNKKAGYGFELPMAVYGTIIKTIKDAGIDFDVNDPTSISRALNNAKGNQQQEVVDKVAKDFGLTIDRKEILSDIQKALDGMAEFQREWAKETEAFAKKLNDAKMKVTTDLWMNPSNRTSAAVDAVADWRDLNMGSDAGKYPGDPHASQAPPLRHAYDTRDTRLGNVGKRKHVGMPEGPGSGVMDNEYYNYPPFNVGYDDTPEHNPYRIFGDGQQPDGPPQGQQAPTGRDANVNQIMKIKKLEKKGVITPKNNNSKVVQNLFKTAMKDYPDRGMPAFVIPEGTPQYKEIIKKFGTNIGSSDGEHGVAWAVPPGGGGFTVWPPNHPPMAPGLSARGPHPKTGKMTIRNLNTPYKPVPRRGPNTPGWGTQPGDPGYGGGGRGFGNALGKLFLGILGILDLTAGKAHAPEIDFSPVFTNPDTPTFGAIPIGMGDYYWDENPYD